MGTIITTIVSMNVSEMERNMSVSKTKAIMIIMSRKRNVERSINILKMDVENLSTTMKIVGDIWRTKLIHFTLDLTVLTKGVKFTWVCSLTILVQYLLIKMPDEVPIEC